MSDYKIIFDKNIERVESLHALYIKLKQNEQKDSRNYKLTDILRAEVVLLHSSFEEYFRSVLIEWLPIKGTEDILKDFPLSINAGKKPERIYLNDLAHYRDKTVNDIITESIAESMALKSFNSEHDIRLWCSKIDIDLRDNQEIKTVHIAVQRRHKIVHEADIIRNADGSSKRLQGIKPGDITPWISAYKSVVDSIEKKIAEWEGARTLCQN